MLLTNIEVTDLLSFEHLDLHLDEGLNVVVGQNDVGKSNLIRLVKLVRDAVVTSPTGGMHDLYGFSLEQRFVRLMGPGFGRVSIGVHFDQDRERRLLLLLVRAVAAQDAEGQLNPPRSQDDWKALYHQISDFVETCLDIDSIADFYRGRITMALDTRQPARWSLAYEFDHGGNTYQLGLQGHGVSSGFLKRGQLDLDQVLINMQQSELPSKMNSSNPSWIENVFDDLLPTGDRFTTWHLQPTQNGLHRPMTLQLARELGLAADNSRLPNPSWVFSSIVGDAIVVTENLRRPPRRRYGLQETRIGVPTEDAGDLPLELYRRKNGDHGQRERFIQLQALFLKMTGMSFDLSATIEPATNTELPAQLEVDLQVQSSAGWVSIEHVGAGLWEALVTLSAAIPEPGQVVLLDEPATHLHASWQLELLRYLRAHRQVVLITHSPFLVPAETPDDFNRVVRLTLTPGGTTAVGIGQSKPPQNWIERWRQIFAGSTDVKAALFVRGVLLVEGDTEIGAFRRWFNDERIVGPTQRGIDAQNLAIISVDGDKNFGAYVSYFDRMKIPWAILCDGPALSPNYRNGLLVTLAADEETGEMPTSLVGVSPRGDDFEDWRSYWASNGVFSLAETFGIANSGEAHTGDSTSSGEVERFFRKIDEELWSKVKSASRSKPRRGYRFAEELNLDYNPEALKFLSTLWGEVAARLGVQ